MYLDCRKIKNGTMKQPMLRLRTLAGKELGAIPFVSGLKFSINYSDVSAIEFTVPYQANGMINPAYSILTSYKVVYTDDLGIYVLFSPTKSGDGVSETKIVTGYSLEYMFNTKRLFLEEGTYNFWNPAVPSDTILGRILELDKSWSAGYVAPRFTGCYRTFDEYDDTALNFCYGDAMEKYRCAFVFDVYDKTVNVYDADEDTETLPIYLDYKNLVESVEVKESGDDLTTKLHLYGSDGLTIRDVNPIGTDYIVNLDYFISSGDLDIKANGDSLTLARRVKEWEAEIAASRAYYAGLVASRASYTAQKLAAQAELVDLQGELDALVAQQSVTIQALALETTPDGISSQQIVLNDLNTGIDGKQREIDGKQREIDGLQGQIDANTNSIQAVTGELGYTTYFTEEERKILDQYLIESDLEEETFVATDIDTSASGATSILTGTVKVSGADLSRVELSDLGKTMYMIAGGRLEITSAGITAEIVRGTLETKSGDGYIFTGYLGALDYDGHNFQSGMITISGTLSALSSDIAERTENEIVEYKGTRFSFSTAGASTYFTVGVNDYQKYSVAMELYDFGADMLDDYAWPVYEFSVNSANFLYNEKFRLFKDRLELGKAVYLRLGGEGIVKPKVIGMELDFDDISSFDLVFSSRYQRKDSIARWVEEIKSAGRSSRNFDASKYIYNRAADSATGVNEFMLGLQQGTVDAILSSSDQNVVFNSTGIHVGGDSNYQLRLTDHMIAMTDDNWKTPKVGIGLFASEGINGGTPIWGINTELLVGNLIIGNDLILQNPLLDENGAPTGAMQFSVDSTGAWLYNSRLVLQNDRGLIIVDPDHGIAAGTKLLFDTNGTTVTPEFLDSTGDIAFDSEGMPKNANFYLDMSGDAYFRGKVIGKSGYIGGYTIENGYLHSGSGASYVALNGGMDVYSAFAIWAGADNPNNAPFYVKKDGSIRSKNGEFSGTLTAAKIKGALTADDSGGDLVGCAIYVPDKTSPKFSVDSSGNVKMLGNLTLSNGAIAWNNLSSSVQNEIDGAYDAASSAAQDAKDAETMAKKIANGEYSGGTFISGTRIYSPQIYAGGSHQVIALTDDGMTLYNGSNGAPIFYLQATSSGGAVIKSGANYVTISAMYLNLGSDTTFEGIVDFSNAKVTGLTATFG